MAHNDIGMHKRSSIDVNEMASGVVGAIRLKVKQHKKNQAAVALGRLGGLKGGKARAEKLTPQERKEIAQKAANARWKV